MNKTLEQRVATLEGQVQELLKKLEINIEQENVMVDDWIKTVLTD